MNKEELQSMSFQLVAHAGEASACFYEAITCAKSGSYEEANEKLELGDKAIVKAHEAQTDLLRAEVAGEDIAFSILLMHAQDHLMTTALLGRMAREFISVYKEMRHED